MTDSPRRVVFDCNIYFQALISPRGPSGKCVDLALARRVELVASPTVMLELPETASDSELRRRFKLTDERIGLLIENVERAATFLEGVPEVFTYERDPDDAHYVNLALASGAEIVVSRDNDLLDLTNPKRQVSRDFAARFPGLRIIEPQVLVQEVEATDTR